MIVSLISRLGKKMLRLAKNALRFPFRMYKCMHLKNKDFTLIAKDCTGGVLLHELFMRFDTPTINACFRAQDFVTFCRDIKYYISQEMREDKDNSSKMGFPVGILGSDERQVHVWFLHYTDFAQAKAKWEERSRRIHWDNIYFIMTDGTGSSEDIVREFDSLPHKHKALLTYRDLPDLKSAVKLKVRRLAKYGLGAPEVFAFKSMFSIKKVIDDWDYISFLNS